MSNFFLSKFTEVLKSRRIEFGYTQVEMSQFLMTSLRTYQRVELGESEPSFTFVVKAAECLKFNLEEILNFNHDKGRSLSLLLRSSKIIEKVSEKLMIGGWEYDVTTKSFYVSDMIKSIREADDNFIPNFESMLTCYDPKDQAEVTRCFNECNLLGNSFYFEKPITTKTGKRKYVAVNGHAEFENGRCIKVYGTTQDVTKRKYEEERQFDLFKEHQEMQSFAGVGIWRLNVIDNVLMWSDSLYSIFEIDQKEFGASYDAFLNLVHPDDREKVDSAYKNSLANKLPYEIEHRILLSNGKIKWVLERCHTDFDQEGRAIYSRGYTLDITRFKQPFPQLLYKEVQV